MQQLWAVAVYRTVGTHFCVACNRGQVPPLVRTYQLLTERGGGRAWFAHAHDIAFAAGYSGEWTNRPKKGPHNTAAAKLSKTGVQVPRGHTLRKYWTARSCAQLNSIRKALRLAATSVSFSKTPSTSSGASGKR